MLTSSNWIPCELPTASSSLSCTANIHRNLSNSSSRPRTPPSTSTSKTRKNEPSPHHRPSASSSSPPFKHYINFLSNTNDDWKADEDEVIGYEEDDGDDFGLPILSNMRRRSKKATTQQQNVFEGPASDADVGLRSRERRHSDSADIAIERPTSGYPMPRKSEGKILRPQYKDILRGMYSLAPEPHCV